MKNDRPEQLPKARTEQLIIKEVDDEVLVYDLTTDRAHCLNDTAAKVWKKCDGDKSVSEIQAFLAVEAGAPVDEGVVWLALDQLEKFKLLAQAPAVPMVIGGMSRRQMIRSLGVAAIALPVIVSIASPTAQAQASCGQSCTGNGGCSSNPVGCRSCNGSPGNKVCGA